MAPSGPEVSKLVEDAHSNLLLARYLVTYHPVAGPTEARHLTVRVIEPDAWAEVTLEIPRLAEANPSSPLPV
jgi:hypothetical protein